MSPSARRVLAVLGRWPRRIAACLCLLLAAGSALAPAPKSSEPPAPSRRLGAGEVAVALPLSPSLAHGARPGGRVGVIAAPDGRAVLVADHLRVVSVSSDADSVVVLIAVDRPQSVAIGRYPTDSLRLVLDDL